MENQFGSKGQSWVWKWVACTLLAWAVPRFVFASVPSQFAGPNVSHLSVVSGYIVIEAQSDHAHPVALILDPSVEVSVVDEKLLSHRSGTEPSLTIGDASLGHIKWGTTKIQKGSVDDSGAKIVGYLGHDVLSKFVFKLDFSANKFSLMNLGAGKGSNPDNFFASLSGGNASKFEINGKIGNAGCKYLLDWVDQGWTGTVTSSTECTTKVAPGGVTDGWQGGVVIGKLLGPQEVSLHIGTSNVIHAPISELGLSSVEVNLKLGEMELSLKSSEDRFATFLSQPYNFYLAAGPMESNGLPKITVQASTVDLGADNLPIKEVLLAGPVVSVDGLGIDSLWKAWTSSELESQSNLAKFASIAFNTQVAHRVEIGIMTPFGLERPRFYLEAGSGS